MHQITKSDAESINMLRGQFDRLKRLCVQGGAQGHQIIGAMFISLCTMMEAEVQTISEIATATEKTTSPAARAEWMGAFEYHDQKLTAVGPYMESLVDGLLKEAYGIQPGYKLLRGTEVGTVDVDKLVKDMYAICIDGFGYTPDMLIASIRATIEAHVCRPKASTIIVPKV